ncbi:MAG: hypothetical protein AB7H92_18630 [Microbacteriaceae bacterium]
MSGIWDVIGGGPSIAVADPGSAGAPDRAAYLEPDGSVTESMGTPRPSARGDSAMTAGAIAIVALAGIIAMRAGFKGAVP